MPTSVAISPRRSPAHTVRWLQRSAYPSLCLRRRPPALTSSAFGRAAEQGSHTPAKSSATKRRTATPKRRSSRFKGISRPTRAALPTIWFRHETKPASASRRRLPTSPKL